MAISREEAIKIISKYNKCANTSKDRCTTLGCIVCENNVNDNDTIEATAKAISDMEKLQKIEEVLKGWNSDNPRDVIHWEKMRMIEQIVKEVE